MPNCRENGLVEQGEPAANHGCKSQTNLLRCLHNELNLGEVLILLEKIFLMLADNSAVIGISKSWLVSHRRPGRRHLATVLG